MLFLRKIKYTRKRYTTTQKEIIIIVETIKDFCKILLVNKIMVYTDHKNLMHNSINHDCGHVLYQRLLVEEHGM